MHTEHRILQMAFSFILRKKIILTMNLFDDNIIAMQAGLCG